MTFKMTSVLEHGLEETASLLNQGFSDYFVPISFDLNALLRMVAHDGLDLASSRIAFKNDKAVGVGLIARRGWSSRLAAMAIVPEAQHQGIGKQFMHALLKEAKTRGDHQMGLEVIAANTPGIKLYEGAGFQTVRNLFSYKLATPQITTELPEPVELDIREVSRLVTFEGLPNLPWQLSGETISGLTSPHRAFQLDDAFIVITNPENEQIHIRSLLTRETARRQGMATKLLQSLFSQFPDKSWHVSAIFPAEMDSFFKTVGFERGELSQLPNVRSTC